MSDIFIPQSIIPRMFFEMALIGRYFCEQSSGNGVRTIKAQRNQGDGGRRGGGKARQGEATGR